MAKTESKLRPLPSRIAGHSRARSKEVGKVLDSLKKEGAVATPESLNRVQRLLTRMETGSDVDLRTPFYAKRGTKGLQYPNRRIVIDILIDLMKGIQVDGTLGGYLSEMENEQMASIGPQSMYLPYSQDGVEKAKAVYSNKTWSRKFNKKAWGRALERFASLVQSQSIGRLSIQEAVHGIRKGVDDELTDGMDTDTNSGLPFAISPWYPKESLTSAKKAEVQEAFDWYMRVSQDIVQSAEEGTPLIPVMYALAGQRLVQKGPEPYEPKSKRLIQMMPKYDAIVGKTFSSPLMEELREVRLNGCQIFVGWTDSMNIDMTMQKLLDNAKSKNRIPLGGDVSAFDATIPPQVLLDVGHVMSDWFRGGSSLFMAMVEAMVTGTGYVTPTGIIAPCVSSMKSGDWSTSLLGSGCNATIQFYGEEIGLYKIDMLTCLGDDFTLEGEGVCPEATSETFAHFNMSSHPEKQFYKEGAIHFLQKLHFAGRKGGIVSVMRTLGHTLSLERMQYRPDEWNKFTYVVRALSQIENTVFNPYFPALVQCLRNGDKEQLGASFTDPMDLLRSAGTAGQEIIRSDTNAPWKANPRSFSNWLVNGVLRGEEYPSSPEDLWNRIYGDQVG